MRPASIKAILRALKLSAVLCAIGIALARPATANPLSFTFTVNAGSLVGTSGYMDVQFNPGALPGTQYATADVDNLSWWRASPATFTGDAVELSIDLDDIFDNQSSFNDVFAAVLFMSPPISFDVTLDGPAVESPDATSISGSTFAVSFFDSNMNPVFTTNPDGFAGIINLNIDGSTSVQTFPSNDDGSLTVTNQNPPPPTPEPGSFLFLGTGVLAAVSFIRRKAQS